MPLVMEIAKLKSKNRWISQNGNCLNAVGFIQRSLSRESDSDSQYSFDVLYAAHDNATFSHALLKVRDLASSHEFIMDVMHDQCIVNLLELR